MHGPRDSFTSEEVTVTSVPKLALAATEIAQVGLPPAAEKVLLLVDGKRTVRDLAIATELPLDQTEAIITRLVARGLVLLR
jgi:hypothetical protein